MRSLLYKSEELNEESFELWIEIRLPRAIQPSNADELKCAGYSVLGDKQQLSCAGYFSDANGLSFRRIWFLLSVVVCIGKLTSLNVDGWK